MRGDCKWPEVEDDADELILRNVRKHGCHIVGIWDIAELGFEGVGETVVCVEPGDVGDEEEITHAGGKRERR